MHVWVGGSMPSSNCGCAGMPVGGCAGMPVVGVQAACGWVCRHAWEGGITPSSNQQQPVWWLPVCQVYTHHQWHNTSN